ncbi:protein of unknown function [Paraburkholderia kururiensis]
MAPAASSLALLPVVLVWLELAELVSVFAPVVELWSHDLLESLHGFAIAYPLKPRARAAADANKVLRMGSSCS